MAVESERHLLPKCPYCGKHYAGITIHIKRKHEQPNKINIPTLKYN